MKSIVVAVGLAVAVAAAPTYAATLFGCTGGGPSTFVTVDTTTGASTPVGLMGVTKCSGLAVNPLSGVLFAVGQDPVNSNASSLFTVDKTTGVATVIGPTGIPDGNVSDLSFRADGQLYGYNNRSGGSGEGFLGTLNTSTGAMTDFTGPAVIQSGNGLAFGPGIILYHAGSAELHTLDQTTGAVLTTTPLALSGVIPCDTPPPIVAPRIDAMALNTTPGMVTMFGIDNCSHTSAPTHLVTINLATGAVTDVGSNLASLDGIAFDVIPSFSIAPALSSGALFACGLLLAIGGIWISAMRTRRSAS